MGANQSLNPAPPDATPTTQGILTVNPTPNQKSQQQLIDLPPRVPPILTVDGLQIDPVRHKQQLDHELWTDLVSIINDYASSRSDLVAARQTRVQEKIVFVDNHVQKFTDSYVNETHKALARMNDDCRKVEEMNKSLHKCTIQSELCVDMLNKLNFLLPSKHKLEALEV